MNKKQVWFALNDWDLCEQNEKIAKKQNRFIYLVCFITPTSIQLTQILHLFSFETPILQSMKQEN